MQSCSQQLVRPTAHVPWDVRIVGSVPDGAANAVKQKVFSMDSVEGWTALASSTQITVFPNDMDASEPTLHQPYTLFHPLIHPADLISISTSTSVGTVLSTSSTTSTTSNTTNPECLHVFAYNQDKHYLAYWMLHPATDSLSVTSKPPNARLALQQARITALRAVGSTLYLGTAEGQLLHCTVTARPMTLTVQSLSRPAGVLSYFLRNATAKSQLQVLLPFRDDVLFSLTQEGTLESWIPTPAVLCELPQVLGHHLEDSFTQIKVVTASANHEWMDILVQVTVSHGLRLYWIRLALPTGQYTQHAWLHRFHWNPATHTVVGLHTASNGRVHAVVQWNEDICTVVAMPSYEVDVAHTVAVGTAPDVTTHGIRLLTTNAQWMRARYMKPQQPPLITRDSDVATTTAAPAIQLAHHLRLAFWHYYQSNQIQLPPSLTTTPQEHLQPTILMAAQQLQQDESITLQWHVSFVDLLQKCGFYKHLDTVGQWILLGNGQELALYPVLQAYPQLVGDNVSCTHVATKLAQVQQHVLHYAPSTDWNRLLQQVLQTAHEYRVQQALPRYDLLDDQHPPRHSLWTHALSDVLLLQLQQEPHLETLASLVEAALQVHKELESQHYALIKSLGITTHVRGHLHDDDLAYKLSLQHSYYEGLCQLSLDHPTKYPLEPILEENNEFCGFCLGWFTQHERYDKVLQHGRAQPELLGKLLTSEVQLQPYQWIHALRQQQYDRVSDCLMQTATGQDVAETQWSLSMAKIAAKVHNKDDEKRRRVIDQKLDLIRCQLALMENGREVPLQSPKFLLQLALEQLDKQEDDNERLVFAAMMALMIADASQDRQGYALVWSKVIAKELTDKWQPWIRGSEPPPREVLIETTLFGQLWQSVQEQPVDVQESMQYNPDDDEAILRNLGLDRGASMELKRLLRFVASVTISKSLMASSIPQQ